MWAWRAKVINNLTREASGFFKSIREYAQPYQLQLTRGQGPILVACQNEVPDL
jgi:hypothetical protein